MDREGIPPIMFEQAFKRIDDVLRKNAGASSEPDYIEQTSGLLLLKYLDRLEQSRAQIAALPAESAEILQRIWGLL
jgi:type I restriction enzyme M protein